MSTCHYCSKEATKLCDWVTRIEAARLTLYMGRTVKAIHTLPFTTLDSPMTTCDRPLCDAHATQQGIQFWCGEEGAIDTEDVCPDHHRMALAGIGLPRPS